MINIIKKASFLLCVITICFYQTAQPMQQATAASRVAAEDIAKAVSDFFSKSENTQLQETLLVDAPNITAIMNNPEFQQDFVDALEDDIKNQLPDCSSQAEDSDAFCQLDLEIKGIAIPEVIKILSSKLAQWLGIDNTEQSTVNNFVSYTEHEKEQLYIALHGRLQQENLPSLTLEKWSEIAEANPQTFQDALDGFYGKTSPAELENTIEQIKKLVISMQPDRSFKQQAKQKASYSPFVQQPQKQQRFWDSAYRTQQQSIAKASTPEPIQRVTSKAPLPPKRRSKETTNCSRLETLKLQSERLILEKLMQNEAALDALIKNAAIHFKQNELQKEELKQRSDITEEATNNYANIAQQLQTSQLTILKNQHLNQQQLLLDEIIETYNNLRKELKTEERKINAAMQHSEKEAIAQQHQREQLVKQQKERLEQNEFDKKLQDQYKKQQNYIKKQNAAEKQKLDQEVAELEERANKLNQKNNLQKQKEEKAAQESKLHADKKELKHQIKKQKKLEKTAHCNQIHTMNQEESARIREEQETQALYDQLIQNFQRATQEIIAQQQKLKDQQTEIELDAINQKTAYENELDTFYKQLRQTEQNIRSQIIAQQAEEASIARAFETLPSANSNPTELEQKQYNDAIAKKIGFKRDEIKIQQHENELRNTLEQELQEQLQKIQDSINAFNKEVSTAHLFETLPNADSNPTESEQKQYNDAIAKKIGFKRDEIKIQQHEKELRNKLEQELQQELQKIQESINAFNKEVLTQQQLEKEQHIANLFETLPDSDIITSATDLPLPKQPETPLSTNQSTQQNAPKNTFNHAEKAPASYAKEPFSDENAQAVQNMFKQNQTDIPLKNNLSSKKSNENQIPLAKKQTDQPLLKKNQAETTEANIDQKTNSSSLSNDQIFSQKNQRPDDQIHKKQSMQNNTKKQFKKTSIEQKQSSSTENSRSNTIVATPASQPAYLDIKQEYFNKKPSSSLQKKSYQPNNLNSITMPYDMPDTTNYSMRNSANDKNYSDNFYPTEIPTNHNFTDATLPYLANQKQISDRSKQLNPTDSMKTIANQHEDIAAKEERIWDKQTSENFAMIETEDQTSQDSSEKVNIFQKTWNRIVTFFYWFFITVKNIIF